MSFPAYKSYTGTGVDWLGEFPAHWGVTSIKHVCNDITDGSHVSPETQNGIYHFVSTKDVLDNTIDFENCLRTSEASYNYLLKTGCKPFVGDVLFSKDGTIGRTLVVRDDRDFVVASSLIIIRPSAHKLDSGFLHHLCQSTLIKDQVDRFVRGAGLPRLSVTNLTKVVGCLPPLDEQKAISSFLDVETSKIDGLVSEQRRLIELLKEKRQAVISHAVTKGLNPNAPMKPSGIQWLGDVPEHWEVMPIKWIVKVPITDGPHETPEWFDDGVPFVSAEAVSSGRVDFSRIRGHISNEDNARYSEKYSPEINDIYMVKSGATTGVTAIVEERTDFNIWSPLAVIRCGERVNPRFVLNYMRSRNFQEGVALNWSFGTQQNIGMGVLENLACTVPPLNEQRAIAESIDYKTEKFDQLLAEAERAIELLQERRTALISAAVTGKIDVREFAN